MTVKELFQDRIFTVSNILSLSRVLAIPAMWFTLAHAHDTARMGIYTAIILAFMVTTDYLDGFLARKLNQETPLGQYLDPVADKLVIVSGLFLLVFYRDFPLWVAILVALREVAGTVGGGYLLIKRNVLGKPNYWGKFGVGMVSLSSLFYLFEFPYREWTIPPLLIVFAGGILAYTKTYGRTIFKGSAPR